MGNLETNLILNIKFRRGIKKREKEILGCLEKDTPGHRFTSDRLELAKLQLKQAERRFVDHINSISEEE